MKKVLKTDNLAERFSQRLFGKNYDALDFNRRLFVYQNLQYWTAYKQTIGNAFLPIVQRNDFKDHENKQVEEWFFRRIPQTIIIEAMQKGIEWNKNNYKFKINSIKFFNKFVESMITIDQKNSQYMNVGRTDYTEKGMDPFMYQAWLDYQNGIHQYFDLFTGPH
jgi:hypothetical protein